MPETKRAATRDQSAFTDEFGNEFQVCCQPLLQTGQCRGW